MVPVKLLILGAQNTGKTALCVRFITKRFIGEYDHKTEVTYRCSRTVDQETVDLEILDLPCKNSVASIESSIRWADGFLLLYSITQRSSFLEIPRLKTLIDKTKQSLVLVANKADLEVGRKVTTEEGQRLAKDLGCGFRELSVAEAVLSVEAVIFQLIRLTLDQQRPLPDRRSYMLTVRHALTRKLTRSKTMQW
ncbi:ras-related and estrogen-regulated growth inhibitor-like isoform X6 [Xiphophorus maculatus]|uniref:ras-related and estrogen-regulated growth inhibitor-like isoform X6 n=1 Tax=Xiphophorus maculatus TaxID=8083 RepID=UPI0003B53E99|nr:ras-related and estrogen-regulated growth inhibitor-like isoform X6 [Xiphophorus maculatus]XP_027863458.1 ras-related and estrogen-regulated growth inhibitor-like isoform X6 [Xiphophorus couchianus]XP_032412822.1 ras-related and estrogen-regulated growth inhibitor-like isoform X6 [Xiphophorus hellerii]